MAEFSWDDLKQAADDAGFSVIAAGVYNCTVKTAETKKTGTGKDKIAVRFTINDGPSAGKSVFNDFIISPENGTALGFFFRHMKALGLGSEYFATKPALSKVATDLVGKVCQVDVGIRVWNEEERNEVKGVKPLTGVPNAAPTGATPQPMAQPQPATPQPQPQPAPAPQPQPTPAPQPVEAAEPVTESDENEQTGGAQLPPDLPF